MKAGKSKTYTAPSRAEVEAMKEQKLRLVPNGEAGRRELTLLRHYSAARDDLQWIVDNNAWHELGFDTFTAWYAARVRPAVAKAGLRPTQEFALYVLENVQSDEARLPKQQQLLQRELADLVGVSVSTLRRLSQDPPQTSNGAGVDLDEPADPDPADVPAALAQALTDTAASIGAGIPTPAADPVTDLCSGDPTRCGTCGDPIPKIEQDAGHLRCRSCDSSTLHKSLHGDDGDFNGVCGRCTQAASVSTEPAQTGLGGESPEERDEEKAAEVEQDPGCEKCGGPLNEEEAKAGFLRCEGCDPDGEHARSLDLDGACGGCGRIPTNTPAAATTSLPDGGGDPMPEPERQPGEDSPTGQDRSDAGANFSDAPESAAIATTGRSGIDHHQVSGVSPGGEAPAPRNAVEPEELEDGDASLLPSPSDYLMLYAAQFALHLAEFDPVALGPQMLDDDVATLLVHVDGFEDFVKSLVKARTP